MNRLALARAALGSVLGPVLPGRVHLYPPTPTQTVAPCVFIDTPRVVPERVGERSSVVVATFPVWLLVDGTIAAAQALLDDLVAQVWSVVESAPLMECRNAEARDYRIGTDPSVAPIRGAVVSVAETITSRVLCDPTTTTPVAVPPELVEV